MPRLIDRDQRKVDLAEAVWRVIRERGIGAVSVRIVAEEAGVAVGSLRHLFPNRAGLLRYSAELMVQRATDRIRGLPPAADPVTHAENIVRELLPLSPDSRAELEVNIALIAETPALPELADVRDAATAELFAACLHIVAGLQGGPRPTQDPIARRLHALIDGVALHLLMQPADADTTWATKIMNAEIRHIVTA